jgi:hypothetical protein
MEKLDDQGKELLKSLRREFPSLKVDFVNDAICVYVSHFWSSIASRDLNGEWKINENVKSTINNYVIFRKLEIVLLDRDPSYRGAYLVVNDGDSKSVHETYDSACRAISSDHAFIGRIGRDASSETVLALSNIEKPVDFDEIYK